MDRVLSAYPPGECSYCQLCWQGATAVAGVYVVHDGQTAYSLMTGYDDTRAQSGAGALAMWHAIMKPRSWDRHF